MVGFHSKTKTVTFAAFLLAVFAFLSRVLGMLRNNFLGNIFPNIEVDMYLASFRIPDLVYGILITGGIVSAFLPVFSSAFKKGKSRDLVRNVFTVFGLSLVLVSFALALLSPQLVKLSVPGFSLEQQKTTASLMRIMFLSPIILGSSAIISGVLHYFNLFLAYALAPVLYNLGIIFGILFFAPKFGLKGVAFGVVLGALFHLIVQLPPFFKKGFSLKPLVGLKSKDLRKIFSLMIPRSIGSAAHHLNLIVLTALGSTLAAGSILIFSYSNDLYSIPLGLVGVSFATAAFPQLSRSFADNDKKEFLRQVSSSFSKVLFLVVPLSFLMFLFRAQIVRLIYGTRLLGQGYFGWEVTRLTAASLGIFSVSVFASCLIPLLSRVFYSFHDTKTPVKIAVLSMVLNIAFAFLFVNLFAGNNFLERMLKVSDLQNTAILALPSALSLSCLLQFFLLLVFLKKKVKKINFKTSLMKILLSSVLMSIIGFLSLRLFDFKTETVLGLSLQLLSSLFLALLSYLFFCYVLKCSEMKSIFLSLREQFRK